MWRFTDVAPCGELGELADPRAGYEKHLVVPVRLTAIEVLPEYKIYEILHSHETPNIPEYEAIWEMSFPNIRAVRAVRAVRITCLMFAHDLAKVRAENEHSESEPALRGGVPPCPSLMIAQLASLP